MIDLKYLRQNPDAVRDAMSARGVDSALVDELLRADEAHREALKSLEGLRARQNELSRGPVAPENMDELRALKQDIKEHEEKARSAEEEVAKLLPRLPNIPLEDTPKGKSSDDNVVVREFGTKPEFAFTPKHYLEIAEKLQLIDVESAAVVSGTRFGYLRGGVALLEFALTQYALGELTNPAFIEQLIRENNLNLPATPFVPVIPPVLIRPEMMRAMGFAERAGVDRGSDEIYYLPNDELYLVGTSEQSVGPMHYDKIIPEEQLPLRYVSFSTCFRRESGAAGKDTRGILRVHQFDKLEMFTVCVPEYSPHEHRLLLACEEALMQGLGLHYRVVRLCTGDIGQASAGTFDIETWMPGQNEYRETHSTSNTTDYQSRALKTRYRAADGDSIFVHMLNGTAFSMNRPIIAILEQFQNEDGSITIPEVLRPFMGGHDRIS